MKKKDLLYLVAAVVVLLVAGYVIYTQLAPKSQTTANGTAVDVIGKFSSNLDENGGLTALNDKNIAHDFSSPVEFSGLNNTAPFGR